MFFRLLILCYIFLSFKYSYERKQYNPDATLQEIKHIDDISFESKEPIIIHSEPIHYESIFEGDLSRFYTNEDKLVRLQDFVDKKEALLLHNKQIIKDLQIDTHLKEMYSRFKTNLSCNYLSSGSIIKGSFQTQLKQCHCDLFIIGVVDGSCKLTLFNPKHKHSIKNKSYDDIMKWGIIQTLDPSKYCIIPANWYYIIDYDNECIQYNISSDTYFTIGLRLLSEFQ